MKDAAFAFFHGHVYDSQATPLVHEFVERRRLQELGFTSDINSLPAWKLDAFIMIAYVEQEVRAKKADSAPKKGRRRRR